MAYSVSSAWIDELIAASNQPVRRLYIGNSEYTDYVLKWPVVRRRMNEIKSVDVSVELSNTDGHLNKFFETTYSMVNSFQLKFGFDISGEELVEIYNGQVKGIRYDAVKATIQAKDKLWDMSDRKVGDSDTTITFSETIPSDIAWDLVTCYGELSSIESTSNPDIDYSGFLAWAEQFSSDNIVMSARYDGQKITEALETLAQHTDSGIWIDAFGKMKFERYTEASSIDLLLYSSDFIDFGIDVNSLKLVNKQYVEADYAQESDYWQIAVFNIGSESVNSYGLHEDLIRDETIWFTTSADASNLAQRIVTRVSEPPVKLEPKTGLVSLQMELNDTIRVVNSFYDIGSDDAWRITELSYSMHTGEVSLVLDGATALRGFYLDIDFLDSPRALL